MAGGKFTEEKLNHVLEMILRLLNDKEVDNWFIGYGTLLGIIRNDSCIENDDDIDILIDVKQKSKIEQIITENRFSYTLKKDMFAKIKVGADLPTIDFYYCHVNDEGDFHDVWEKVVWSKTTPLIKRDWKDTILYIPQNYETKLIGRYGETWKIPKQWKGVKPKKTRL